MIPCDFTTCKSVLVTCLVNQQQSCFNVSIWEKKLSGKGGKGGGGGKYFKIVPHPKLYQWVGELFLETLLWIGLGHAGCNQTSCFITVITGCEGGLN